MIAPVQLDASSRQIRTASQAGHTASGRKNSVLGPLDVAALARMAAASVDDVAAGASQASLKAAGVIVDDAAVTPRYVFGARSSWRRRLLLAFWYVGTYGVGLGLIALLQTALDAPRLTVVLITVSVTAPLSFTGARLLVGRVTPEEWTPRPDREALPPDSRA